MFDHVFKANILVKKNLVQLNRYTISGKAQFQTKTNFFPGVGTHFWGDFSHPRDDSFSEVIYYL